ncbi:MAG: hypothetical protein A4E36_00845 [Methanoregulaceae archaeon PtaB.Bin009]|nr:MAG: hypothetical protein A4E36_00845 [Methanoregulaceae archaeon PtaB.Bin009]
MAITRTESQMNPVSPPARRTRNVSGLPKNPTPSRGSSIFPSTRSW